MSRFIYSSGKMVELHRLLQKLHQENHRVLVFCQMTKMMDLLEEYLWYMRYSFFRMDGSTPVGERRDMVHDFQTRDDIFLFLLSTRAGGLGITLTAADTVIFYDHDWNPTSDEQATDRAHRIGQEKQVTVYRLVAKGTIEERIMLRALQKRNIQKAVYEGKVPAEQAAAAEKTVEGRDMVDFLLGDDEALNRASTRPTAASEKRARPVDEEPEFEEEGDDDDGDAADWDQNPSAVPAASPENGLPKAKGQSVEPSSKRSRR
jgi:DNA helicase INO80